MQSQRPSSDLPAETSTTSERPLQSWKEIAAYLDRAERTARRWEKIAGLPVHRLHQDKRSSVYAYPSELDAWRAANEPKANGALAGSSWWRWSAIAAAGVLVVVVTAWFVKFGPILNPPNPLVEAEGITLRQVWAGTEADSFGAPSPDGRYLSFVDWDTGDLALRDLATEENRRLTDKGPWSESFECAQDSIFSPDSKQIVYIWRNKDNSYDLRLAGVNGSPPRILCRKGYVHLSDWSPDGRYVLGVLWQDGTAQIGLISVADGSVQIVKTMDQRFPRKMSLSPDGRYIVYDFPPQQEHPNRDLFLLSTDAKREIPLVQHSAHDLHPVWTPDGKQVVFVSDRTGTRGLWIVRVVDGKPQGSPRLIKADIGRFSPMDFTQDGALYYGLETGMFDVYLTRVDLNGGKILEEPARVSQRFVGFNLMPDWSSDGTYLSYLSRRSPLQGNRNDGARIVVRTVATGEEREIMPKLRSSTLPRWSPDGRFFLVSGRDTSGYTGVYKVDAKTGDATVIFERQPHTLERDMTWSRDEKAIFYRRYNTVENHGFLIYRDLESGQEKELFRTPSPDHLLRRLALSRDGQRLAFLLENYKTEFQQAIHVMPAAGGEPRELLRVEEPEIQWSLEWTPDDQEILFVKFSTEAGEQEFELMAISTDGGEARKLGVLREGVHDLRLHPDGNLLAFSVGQRKVEVWVMEDFLPEP